MNVDDGWDESTGRISIFGARSTLYKNCLMRHAFNVDDLDLLRSTYIPSENDVFIVTYPKCGTTWLGDICMELRNQFSNKNNNNNGEKLGVPPYLMLFSQSREKFTQYINKTKNTIRFWKIHVPFKLLPIKSENYNKNTNKKIKVVIISRNPKDACVSFYYHRKNYQVRPFNGDFDLFFTLWTSGMASNDSYFNWHKEWYDAFMASKNNRNNINDSINMNGINSKDFNIHWMYYEDVKINTRDEIIKLANFLGFRKQVYDCNGKNKSNYTYDDIIDNVVKKTSFEIKEKYWNKRLENFISNFLRKGVIGDWKNHLNENQSKIIDYLIDIHFYNRSSFKYYKDLKSKRSYIVSKL